MTPRRDFIATSGFARVCTTSGIHRHTPTRQRTARTAAAQRRADALRSALLATLIGAALAALLFIGLSGGFRP
jgi:hypothetical protein